MENEINYNEIITKLESVATDGFETYVQGVFVSSILWLLFNVVIIALACLGGYITYKAISEYEEDLFSMVAAGIIPAVVITVCLYGTVISLQGIFMPEFVAINEMIGR
ncbi:hypothetical protein EDD62_1753 [Abyssicoccus albus]|uniref:Uncharacterized protein n=1 Tax=Abyssicoccus albus TaxID=1817405 RepID=A0A3N5C5V2_9BACL|nr:hypothetical protein EDD62_1753 [Abyssicoccus albus]